MPSLAVDYFFFSNGFCANQLSILVTEKNKFKIKKIILNGFKITALAEKPVKSLSLCLISAHSFWITGKNIHHPLCMLFCLPGLVFSENIWRFSLPGAFWLAFLIFMLANKHGPVFHSLMRLERPPTCSVLETTQLNRCQWVSIMHPVMGCTTEMQSYKGHSPNWLTSCLGRETGKQGRHSSARWPMWCETPWHDFFLGSLTNVCSLEIQRLFLLLWQNV